MAWANCMNAFIDFTPFWFGHIRTAGYAQIVRVEEKSDDGTKCFGTE
jgi:hypothetical protein